MFQSFRHSSKICVMKLVSVHLLLLLIPFTIIENGASRNLQAKPNVEKDFHDLLIESNFLYSNKNL